MLLGAERERNKIDFVVGIRTKNTPRPVTRVILTCWPEAMVNVVIGMAIGTACITPAVLEAATGPGVPGLLTSAEFREAGEAVITLVAVVVPEPVTATAASLPAVHCWMLAPGPEMMVAGPGRMWARVPVYSGFS